MTIPQILWRLRQKDHKFNTSLLEETNGRLGGERGGRQCLGFDFRTFGDFELRHEGRRQNTRRAEPQRLRAKQSRRKTISAKSVRR